MLGMSYLGGLWLAGLVAALSFLGLREFYGLARSKGLHPLTWWGIAGGLLLIIYLSLRWQSLLALLVLWLLLIMSRMVFRDEVEEAISRIGITIMGVLYIPFLFGHMLLLRADYSFTGYKLLFFSMVLVWLCDTGAYFGGMMLGKHPLAPHISPKKSIEGLIGGLLVTIVAAVLLQKWWLWEITVTDSLIIAAGVVVLGTFGRSGGIAVQAGCPGQGHRKSASGPRRDTGSVRQHAVRDPLCLLVFPAVCDRVKYWLTQPLCPLLFLE